MLDIGYKVTMELTEFFTTSLVIVAIALTVISIVLSTRLYEHHRKKSISTKMPLARVKKHIDPILLSVVFLWSATICAMLATPFVLIDYYEVSYVLADILIALVLVFASFHYVAVLLSIIFWQSKKRTDKEKRLKQEQIYVISRSFNRIVIAEIIVLILAFSADVIIASMQRTCC